MALAVKYPEKRSVGQLVEASFFTAGKLEVFGNLEEVKNIKIFDTSAEHKVAFSRQLNDDFHIV